MLLAKSSAAAAHVSQQFTDHSVSKLYFAVARGWPPTSQRIDWPLSRLDQPAAPPQAAVTSLQSLARIELDCRVETYPRTRYSLLALQPETGRRHQLRRHLKHLHHPLVGDTIYGRGAHNRFFRQHLACERLLLHHAQLSWLSRSGVVCQVHAPFDPNWLRVLAAFAWTHLPVLHLEQHRLTPLSKKP